MKPGTAVFWLGVMALVAYIFYLHSGGH